MVGLGTGGRSRQCLRCSHYWFPPHHTKYPPPHTPLLPPNILQLLGELLLDRTNVRIMMQYVSDVNNLVLMMNLLKDHSRSIQFEAFHVFKVGAGQVLSVGLGILCPKRRSDVGDRGAAFMAVIDKIVCPVMSLDGPPLVTPFPRNKILLSHLQTTRSLWPTQIRPRLCRTSL